MEHKAHRGNRRRDNLPVFLGIRVDISFCFRCVDRDPLHVLLKFAQTARIARHIFERLEVHSDRDHITGGKLIIALIDCEHTSSLFRNQRREQRLFKELFLGDLRIGISGKQLGIILDFVAAFIVKSKRLDFNGAILRVRAAVVLGIRRIARRHELAFRIPDKIRLSGLLREYDAISKIVRLIISRMNDETVLDLISAHRRQNDRRERQILDRHFRRRYGCIDVVNLIRAENLGFGAFFGCLDRRNRFELRDVRRERDLTVALLLFPETNILSADADAAHGLRIDNRHCLPSFHRFDHNFHKLILILVKLRL
nr:MAG TPA: hypothetical protein [Caudoviricetes sp.]